MIHILWITFCGLITLSQVVTSPSTSTQIGGLVITSPSGWLLLLLRPLAWGAQTPVTAPDTRLVALLVIVRVLVTTPVTVFTVGLITLLVTVCRVSTGTVVVRVTVLPTAGVNVLVKVVKLVPIWVVTTPVVVTSTVFNIAVVTVCRELTSTLLITDENRT